MFGKAAKKQREEEAVREIIKRVTAKNMADLNASAKVIIAKSIAEVENKHDRAYATGLIEMAYELEIITMNERAALKEKLYSMQLKK